MNSLKFIKAALSLLALSATLIGCGGGGSGSPSLGPDVVQVTTLKVVVQDEARSPISAARVRVGGADLNTDAAGQVNVVLANSATETVALVTKSGFATNAKTAVIYAGKATELSVTLFAH